MFKKLLIILAFITAYANPLWAEQEPRNYAVLPFEINGPQEYSYLSRGIQSMLSSRLAYTGQTSPVSTGEINQVVEAAPSSYEEAEELMIRLNADFVVFGTANIVENQCNLDIYAAGLDLGRYSLSKQTSLGQLIPALEEAAQELMNKVVGEVREEIELEPLEPQETPAVQPPEEADIYVSPHFQFQDDPQAAGRWRSQTLPFASRGIVAGDAQGTGESNIFILSRRQVHAYTMHDNRLKHIATYEAPLNYENLNINILDTNRNGRKEIIVSAMHTDRVWSYILGFENEEFHERHVRVPFFMNVVNPPPAYEPTLIGQRKATGNRLFRPGGVQEVIFTGSGPELERRLSLPDKANVFNFNYLPRDNDHLVIIAEDDRLHVYSSDHRRRHITSNEYAGSGLGLEIDDPMPGMGQTTPHERDVNYYYIPTRLVTAEFQGENEYRLLTHKHFAGRMASIFQRYRNFPEGEIHALYYDDIGLNLHWNTRRIKAGVADFGLFDIDGDGGRELVISVNTHPGVTGMQESRTIVLAYKLE